MSETRYLGPLPSPPPGGGILVLNKYQYENTELRALITEIYPNTKVVLAKKLPEVSQ